MLRPPEPVAPPPPSNGHLEARVRPKFPNTGLPASKFGMLRIKRVFGRVPDQVREDSDERVGLGCSRSQAKSAGAARVNGVIAIAQQLVYMHPCSRKRCEILKSSATQLP